MRSEDRVVLLAHGQWGLFSTAKTGIQLMRYGRCKIQAVVNPDAVGTDAAAAVDLAHKGPVPVHADLDSVLKNAAEPPTQVLIAIAPEGGRLPPDMRADVTTAIKHRIPVFSGLHTFLSDDPELAALATTHGTPLIDLRRPPLEPTVATGAGRSIPIPIVTTVGTDCRSGKMTVAVALREAAREMGLHAAFVATGQTGQLLEPDAGAPIDRVISDFAAGEVERQVRIAARLGPDGERTDDSPDLILVEGQGALSHPAYAGVSAAILHGSWPDCLVLAHVHGRTQKTISTAGPRYPVLPPATELRLIHAFMQPVHPTPIAAVALAAPGLDERAHATACQEHADATGLPVFDCVRHTGRPLLQAVLETLQENSHGKQLPKTLPFA